MEKALSAIREKEGNQQFQITFMNLVMIEKAFRTYPCSAHIIADQTPDTGTLREALRMTLLRQRSEPSTRAIN